MVLAVLKNSSRRLNVFWIDLLLCNLLVFAGRVTAVVKKAESTRADGAVVGQSVARAPGAEAAYFFSRHAINCECIRAPCYDCSALI